MNFLPHPTSRAILAAFFCAVIVFIAWFPFTARDSSFRAGGNAHGELSAITHETQAASPVPGAGAGAGDSGEECCSFVPRSRTYAAIPAPLQALAERLGTAEVTLLRTVLPARLEDRMEIDLNFPDGAQTVVLQRRSVRGKHFQVLTQNEDGSFLPHDVGEVSTYAGHPAANPDAEVYLTFTPAGMRGRLYSGTGGETLVIEPLEPGEAANLGRAAPAGTGVIHAVYPASAGSTLPAESYAVASETRRRQMNLAANSEPGVDVAETGFGPDADGDFVPVDLGIVPMNVTGLSVSVKQAEMGFDIARTFYANRGGSNITTTANMMESWINDTLNKTFIPAMLVEHTVGTIIIRTTAATDPYDGMSDAYAILPKIKDIWNGNNAAFPRPSTTHDIATCALSQSVGVTGLASVGVVGTSSKYSLATAVSGLGYWTSGLRHEVGHNYSLGHGDGCGEPTLWWDTGMGIMCGGYHDRLNSREAEKMIAHRNSRAAGVLGNLPVPYPINVSPFCPQDIGFATTINSAPITLDVLANDYDANNQDFSIEWVKTRTGDSIEQKTTPAFMTTNLGGKVIRSIGTGPSGRDVLLYTAPVSGAGGVDEFHYGVRDTSGGGSWGFVRVTVGGTLAAIEPKTVNPASYLADSIIEWSQIAQGTDDWQYGERSAGTTGFNLLTTHRDDTFAIGGDGSTWLTGTSRPILSQNAALPEAARDAVRRWTSDYTGDAIAELDLFRLETTGNGQTIRLEQNGTLRQSIVLSAAAPHRVVKVSLTLTAGDTLDLVVTANGEHSGDWTHTHLRVIRADQSLTDPTVLFHLPLDESGVHPDVRRLKAADTSGNNRHATVLDATPTSIWKPGAQNNALWVDGVNDQAVLDQANIGDGASEITISVWFKPEAKNDNDAIISTTGDFFSILVSGYGTGRPVEFRAKNNRVTGPDNTGLIGRWTHAVGTWKSGQFQRLYLDGVEVAGMASGAPAGTVDIDKWKLGIDRDTLSRTFQGLIDDVTVWSRALDAGEVRVLFVKGQDAMDYNGTTDFTTVPYSPVPLDAAELTLSAWIRPDTKGANRGIVTSDPTGNYHALLQKGVTGFPIESRAVSSSLAGADDSGPINQWSHVVSVWKSGQIHKIYVDGIEEMASASPPAGVINTPAWIIGRDRLISGRFFDGMIGDVAILNRALSEGDAFRLFANGATTTDSSHGLFSRSGRVGGTVLSNGDLRESSGIFALTGVGAGLSGSSDDFEFLSRPHTGDGALTLRVEGMRLGVSGASGGLMFRESLDAGAPLVLLRRLANGTLSLEKRVSPGGLLTTVFTSVPGRAPPGAWLRLARNGNTLTAGSSTDGTFFTTLDKAVLLLSSTSLTGLSLAPDSTSLSSTIQISSPTFSTQPLDPDADADQLADDFELQYFNSLNATTGATDSDGDGMTNAQEAMAGTNPLDPRSLLAFTGSPAFLSEKTLRLEWQSVPGKSYRLWGSSTLGSGSWTLVQENITGSTVIIAIPIAAPGSYYYKIEVKP